MIKGCKCCKIYTSLIEHHAILNACIEVALDGTEVNYMPVNHTGIVEPQVLDGVLTENSLVSIMMANNEIGTILPIKQLAKLHIVIIPYFIQMRFRLSGIFLLMYESWM